MKKSGFTMIELVFVIVILGILSAIAIPKLIGTRDDARAEKDVQNLVTARTEVMSGLLLGHSFDSIDHADLTCFTLTNDDTNRTVTVTVASTSSWCSKAFDDANKSNLLKVLKY